MANPAGNIFAELPQSLPEEVFQELIHGERFRLERIISFGQATPAGEWYDQEQHEWVLLLSGAAGLRFEGEEGLRVLSPGDFVNIPAHTRHRVEWTDEKQSTICLALHYSIPEMSDGVVSTGSWPNPSLPTVAPFTRGSAITWDT